MLRDILVACGKITISLLFLLVYGPKKYTSKAKVGLQNIEKVLFSLQFFFKKLLVFKYV